MAITLGKLFVAGFVILAFLVVLMPMVIEEAATSAQPGTNSLAYQQLQSVIINYTGKQSAFAGNGLYQGYAGLNGTSIYGGLALQIRGNVIGNSTGLSAPVISSFTGAAFILSTLPNLIINVVTLGWTTANLMWAILSFLPSPFYGAIGYILLLFGTYVMIYIIFLGASTWSKYNIFG